MITKDFDSDYLIGMGVAGGVGHHADGTVIVLSDEIVDHTRWSVHHEVIFQLPGQKPGTAWKTHYSVGATEYQDEGPWQYEPTVTCSLVREQTVMVKQWIPAEEDES